MNKKSIKLIIASLVLFQATSIVLVSCSKQKQPFEGPVKSNYVVEYHYFNSEKSLEAEYNKKIGKNKGENTAKGHLKGFSYHYSNNPNVCHITLLKPSLYSLKELQTTIGHENLHCMFGTWHPLGGPSKYPSRLIIKK